MSTNKNKKLDLDLTEHFTELENDPKIVKLREKMLKKLHKLPQKPGFYKDSSGDRWMLTVEGRWVDKDGRSADPRFNWLLVKEKFKPVN